MRILHVVITPLRSADTYRRWVHLVLGGVLFFPFLIAALVVFTLVGADGVPAVDAAVGWRGPAAFVVAVAVGASTAWLPAVRAPQLQVARHLLGGALSRDPVAATVLGSGIRAVLWLALHLTVGFAVSLGTMIGLTEAALLALAPIVADPVSLLDGVWRFLDETAFVGAARWRAPLAGAALVLLVTYGVALVGALAARLAPILLGPSAADRLAAAELHADDLSRRNRLAAELHDSIGHALSVVTLQAGAAARVIDHDPAFARAALDAIAEQARTATAELDHVLGVLRDERASTAPARTLMDLEPLVEAVRTTGADVRLTTHGLLDAVPAVVSREAYRICQEALTNALRHGEASTPVTVGLDVEAARLRVTIANASAVLRSRAGGGRGLATMRERVRLLGGHLDAGMQDGTWRLVAVMPWEARHEFGEESTP